MQKETEIRELIEKFKIRIEKCKTQQKKAKAEEEKYSDKLNKLFLELDEETKLRKERTAKKLLSMTGQEIMTLNKFYFVPMTTPEKRIEIIKSVEGITEPRKIGSILHKFQDQNFVYHYEGEIK